MTKKEKVEEIVLSLNIIDDTLFQKMAEDIGFCEELLSTVLKQKVTVEQVIPQNTIKNLQGHSVILDALCVLEDGKRCNIEVQKAKDMAKRLFENGVDFDIVYQSIKSLSKEELQTIFISAVR